ncbi:hypothetical protein PEC311524_07400 [Pectobacterium carotovorum subsp. carotovorum]|nr:hypothetical protein PEC311524_07400 [Pectobacterium carotovorum subsp. carotovorum]
MVAGDNVGIMEKMRLEGINYVSLGLHKMTSQ